MLSTQQIQSFVEHNYIVLEDCFSAETAQEWVENVCQQSGIDLQTPAPGHNPTAFRVSI